jgi:hypothetical protein
MDENRLRQMLAGSRAIMDKVETGDFRRGNIDQSKMIDGDHLIESPPPGMVVENEYEERPYIPPAANNGQAYRNLHTTKMPKEIVEAMINNPINIPDSPYHTFEATDDLIKEVNPEAYKRSPSTQRRQSTGNVQAPNPAQRLAETKRTSLMSGLSEDEVRAIVRDEMESIIYEYFDQRVIKEDFQIKIGSTIFSGTMSPLPAKKASLKKKNL